MPAITSDYSRHGDINLYIEKYHPRPNAFRKYRTLWDDSTATVIKYLLLETTSKCNLKCGMCIHSTGYPQVSEMTDKLFDDLVNHIKKNEIPSIAMNQVNEPLLDKKIINRILQISDIECVQDIMMNTNGVLLNEEKSIGLVESGLTRLLFGFDAYSPEVYKMVRGASHQKTLGNILKFLEIRERKNKKFPVLRVSFVRMNNNEHELDDWFNFWKDKADYLSIQEFIPPTINFLGELNPNNNLRKNFSDRGRLCDQPFKQLVVRGDGNVLPCCSHMATEMPVGNLADSSLSEIHNGLQLKKLREELTGDRKNLREICRACLNIA